MRLIYLMILNIESYQITINNIILTKMNKQHATKCPANPSEPDAFKVWKTCTCDGYHTFDELYEHRIVIYIALCRKLALQYALAEYKGLGEESLCWPVWRSKLHSDGSAWDGWFVLGIGKGQGEQLTYHLPMSMWDKANFAETLEKAPEFDGHTSDDVLERLKNL